MNAVTAASPLSDAQLANFADEGYLVIRGLADPQQVQAMRAATLAHLVQRREPIEYEADVAYPGAPADRDAPGGDTARRLLQAYDRHPAFAAWARDPQVTAIVFRLLDADGLRLTRCHHNCVMTKQPAFSSVTGWHQDLRYWSFTAPRLINTWLALGPERPANGCMRLLPGSHRYPVDPWRLDRARFLRPDLPANRAWIETAQNAELASGDGLFFHAGIFHAAGRNASDQRKLSVVFTYHGADTEPLPGSRSARLPPVVVPCPAV